MTSEEVSQSESTLNHLKAEIKTILDPKFSTLGHGTRLEAAKKILEDGLRAKFPDLGTTTVSLLDSSKPINEQVNQAVETILNLKHLNSKAVVLIQIPNPPEDSLGGLKYFNSVFKELDEPETSYENRWVIPSAYLIGYVDVAAQKFILNPLFDPKPLPTVKLDPSG